VDAGGRRGGGGLGDTDQQVGRERSRGGCVVPVRLCACVQLCRQGRDCLCSLGRTDRYPYPSLSSRDSRRGTERSGTEREWDRGGVDRGGVG
jgi:hypothetical protein